MTTKRKPAQPGVQAVITPPRQPVVESFLTFGIHRIRPERIMYWKVDHLPILRVAITLDGLSWPLVVEEEEAAAFLLATGDPLAKTHPLTQRPT